MELTTFNCIWIYAAAFIIPSTRAGSITVGSDGIDEVEFDCALDAAPACFYPITKLLNCTAPGSLVSPSCGIDLLLNPLTLESFCSSADEALNGCLVDLLGASCLAKDPKHSHLQEWLKPLNIVLRKLCKPESMLILADSFGCEGESIFKCLFSTTATDETDLVQILTTQIPPEVCANIEFRGQFCLATATSSFPVQCKSLLRLLKELTQDFVDNTDCNLEPLILIPMKEKPNPTGTPVSVSVEDSDRTCELDPVVASACFEPVVSDWKCYFSMGTTGCNFSLNALCKSTREALESCVMDLIGYGCKNIQEHRFYNEWLGSLRTVHKELCPANAATLEEEQNLYFHGKVPCWIEFFTCFHSIQNQKQLIMLMTEEINSSICRELADNVDYCLMALGFSGQPYECDNVLDKIQAMKNRFVNSPYCNNSTRAELDLIGQGEHSSAQIPAINYMIFTYLIVFIFIINQ